MSVKEESEKQIEEDAQIEEHEEQDQLLRRRLLRRIAVAFVLILCLVGGLAVFDSMIAVAPPSKTVAAKAPEVPPPLPVTPPEQKAPEPAVKEEEVVPESTETPNADVLKGAPARERPLTVPATPRQAMVKQSDNRVAAAAPAPAPAPATAPRGREIAREVAREVARVVPPVNDRHAPASRPLTQGREAREINRNFVIQMGVFNNAVNAEELRARLEMNGIPARVEARVHVGPFKTRQEAEAAQKKLTALGIDPGMLVSSKR